MERKYVITTFKLKSTRTSKKATPDGFNGYGKYRPNTNIPYGYLSQYQNKKGIYYLKNRKTNLIYIGSSSDIGKRISKHFSQLKIGNHPNHKLLNDFNKYGIDSFEYGVLEYTDENLKNKECDYQLKYGINNLYNLQIKDNYHSDTQLDAWKKSNKNVHKSSDYRNKMRDIKKNRIGQFDINTGELIQIYDCKEDACAKYNIAASTLMGCCNGSKKSAKGYIWRYIDNNGNVIAQGKGKNRTIIIQNEDIV